MTVTDACDADTVDYEERTKTLCYICTVVQSVEDERDHVQGTTGCADPFDGSSIPRHECKGECGVSYSYHHVLSPFTFALLHVMTFCLDGIEQGLKK